MWRHPSLQPKDQVQLESEIWCKWYLKPWAWRREPREWVFVEKCLTDWTLGTFQHLEMLIKGSKINEKPEQIGVWKAKGRNLLEQGESDEFCQMFWSGQVRMIENWPLDLIRWSSLRTLIGFVQTEQEGQKPNWNRFNREWFEELEEFTLKGRLPWEGTWGQEKNYFFHYSEGMDVL